MADRALARLPNGRVTGGAVPTPRGAGLGALTPHAVIGYVSALALAGGWLFSDALDLSPSDGVGYALGIFGLTAMAVLLLYSVRKRVRALRRAGSMRIWFEAHLILGLLGPTAILYHCNFELGSLNSTISLACMLAVAGSGVGGRFLYGRMHRSLAGDRLTASALLREANRELSPIDSVLERCPDARIRIETFRDEAVTAPAGFASAHRLLTHRIRARAAERRVLGAIRASTRPHVVGDAVRGAVRRYFATIVRSQDLRLFERMFSLWHAIHVPLTFILFLSATVHVLAVHAY